MVLIIMHTSEPHTLGSYDAALRKLRGDVIKMGALGIQNFINATHGLLQRDITLCNLAIAEDEEIDDLEVSIDRLGFETILRYQPMAGDLREVISAIKISTNLERIGDQATTIARRARKLNSHESLVETSCVEGLVYFALDMLQMALRAYSDRDRELASEQLKRDKDLDRMCKDFESKVSDKIPGNSDAVRGYLNLILISRAIERIGDHSKNLLEDVIYITDARDIRHQR